MQRLVSSAAALPAAAALSSSRRCAHTSHLSKSGMDGFSDLTFNTNADHLLESLETSVETLDSDLLEDISMSDGVLNIDTAKGSYVINKQAPNLQLWLSSPISGPHHYDMTPGAVSSRDRWISDRDGHSLVKKLEIELTETLGKEFRLIE